LTDISKQEQLRDELVFVLDDVKPN
jgi:hypothetical protein